MTATPERTDELNIFELFNYNIAYEIRLQEALESNILCPFHYFGVTDYIQNEMSQEDAFNLKYLASNERVEHIIKKTNYYGYSGDVLKGLIFVSSRGEAYQLANQLSKRGISSVGLTGKDSIAYRAETIQQLKEGSINYIITVDLFNEGIDIPEINQVVMLRPTKSSIIFIQQLGRGLRKSTNKEFVTVIDFIGNYKTNYMIPIALSGNKSQNKDNYRKFLTDTTVLNGVSTINFEEVAKNKIYNSLDSVKLNQPKLIKEAFNNVKDRIGKLPLLMDFINNDSIDPSVIFSRFKNYYEFLIKNKIIENELSINEFKNLTFLSRQLTPGLKKVDIDVLKEIIQNDVTYENLTKKMLNINNDISEYDINTSLSILDFTFFKKTIGKTYGLPLIQYKDNLICLANEFKEALNKPLFNTFVHDLIDLANYNNDRYQNKKNSLILYNKYSREDFVKLLNWDKDESGTINGYRMKHRTLPLFITYDKHENISDNTKYDDEFLSQDELKWYTRSNRKLTSPEVQNILKHEENNTDMYIFVKKRDDEGKYFYYLGKAKYIKGTEKQDYMPNGNSVVTMHLSMNTSIRDDIYRYIT
ncbi:helicase [Staphylococcus epidermidis]|nr:helicase [Staphylococcus epidermidis]